MHLPIVRYGIGGRKKGKREKKEKEKGMAYQIGGEA